MSRVHQLIYVSAARKPFSAEELDRLLESSRKSNERAGITGLLLYENGSFLQLIEGPEEAVRATYARIERDPRHHRVMKIQDADVGERSFPNWSMGYPRMGDVPGKRPDGYTDFFAARSQTQAAPATSVAQQIIDAFRQGRWHIYVG